MKLKGTKVEKPVAKDLVKMKKSKISIQKTKKSMGVELKPSAAKAAKGAKTEQLEKKNVFNKGLKMVKANQNEPNTGNIKMEQENLPPLKQQKANGTAARLKQEKKQKQKQATEPMKDESEEENPTKPQNEKTEARKEEEKKKKALKKKQQRAGGELPKKVTEDTLALVPEKLISEESFQKVYETMHQKFTEKGHTLFGDDLKYAMQILSVKIPRCPLRNCRVALPHSLLRKDDEICLIVKDLIRGRKVDFSNTLEHWEEKLKELAIEYKVRVLPFQQLKRDYGPFEMKRKLQNRYERFVVDACIGGHVFAFLGSHFAKRGKNPIVAKLDTDARIKASLEQALHLQSYRQGNSGVSTEIKFAAHWMPTEHAVENGMALMENLKSMFPGGWLNVRTIKLATVGEKSYSLPIYESTIDANLVPVPIVVGPRQKFVKKQQKLFAKQTDGKYEVTKDGVVRRVKNPNAEGEDNGPDSDVEMELDDLEPEDDDNWVPYDDDVPSRPRQGGRPRERGPKIRNIIDSVGEDSRNKRNVRYYTYDDPQNDDLFPGYGEIVHPPQAGLAVKQCKPEPTPSVQSISISDHSWTSIGSSIIHLLKYLIAGLAVLTLPVLLLQAFILPLKILMGLKSVAVANTLVLGTFLWKYLNRHRIRDDDDDDDDDDDGGGAQQSGSGTPGTTDGSGNGMINGNDNRFFPFRAEDFENMTEEEIKTALKLLLKRNKRWKPIMVLRSRKTAIIKDGVIT
uniref:Uncharacterized protein n=1 Tax=Anopheles christyi TaxID=43041 RepID=A0A182JYX8_9DIPT